MIIADREGAGGGGGGRVGVRVNYTGKGSCVECDVKREELKSCVLY